MTHTPRIPRQGDILESERLARRWFSLVEHGAFDQLGDLVHPSIVVVSKIRPGLVVEGKDAFLSFVQETLANALYEAATSAYRALDADRIVIEGRIRWMDEQRVLRDDPVTWALAFEEGLLRLFVSAKTAVEAETLLLRGDA